VTGAGAVAVAGIGFSRPTSPEATSLPELVFQAASAALVDAGLSRADLDGVCLAASDQLDGRAISSMQLAGPSGAYLKDEIKVGDDGSLAYATAVLRIEAGVDRRVLAMSWTKSSESPPETALGVNAEPVYARPAGLHPLVAEAAVSAMFLSRHGLPASRVVAPGNDAGDFVCWPLRSGHLPPATDGAVALVLSADPGEVEVAGLAWGVEAADPTARRLTPEAAVAAVAGAATREAGIPVDTDLLVETTDRTPFRLAMTLTGLGLPALAGERLPTVNRSGGLWASNPIFAAGLERVAHAALAVRDGVPAALAHSSYGYAGQGQFVTVLRRGVSHRTSRA
jgi:acetyl-CoA acetyltransferase